jgi:hypothetical protein
MNIEDLTIGEARKIAAAFGGGCPAQSRELGKMIVVGQRGWVWIGKVREDGDYIVIDECSCVRNWGTSHGLGELATNGPTAHTVLDPQPQTRVHRLAVVEMIQCVK